MRGGISATLEVTLVTFAVHCLMKPLAFERRVVSPAPRRLQKKSLRRIQKMCAYITVPPSPYDLAPALATVALHSGHVRSRSNHSPTHSSQNTCRHPSRTGLSYLSWQMAQQSPLSATSSGDAGTPYAAPSAFQHCLATVLTP